MTTLEMMHQYKHDALEEATSTIEECGWTQLAFKKETGECCLSYAVEQACRSLTDNPKDKVDLEVDVYGYIMWYLRQRYPEQAFFSLAGWNDFICKDKETVIEILKGAADELY